VFVFINNKLALDLGGLHSPLAGGIDVDASADVLGLRLGENYKLKVFQAERKQTGSSFKISTSIIKTDGGICPKECFYASGQGVCDLESGECLCCPGFSGADCGVSNTEARCPTQATSGQAAMAADDNCYNTVFDDTGTQPGGVTCGYPSTGTWVDACYAIDPDNIADQLAQRCVSDYNNAFTQVDVGYFNSTSMVCETAANCPSGFFVANYNSSANATFINRICEACSEGQFAAGFNLPACTDITDPSTCDMVIAPATSEHDTVCATPFDFAAEEVSWYCDDLANGRPCQPMYPYSTAIGEWCTNGFLDEAFNPTDFDFETACTNKGNGGTCQILCKPDFSTTTDGDLFVIKAAVQGELQTASVHCTAATNAHDSLVPEAIFGQYPQSTLVFDGQNPAAVTADITVGAPTGITGVSIFPICTPLPTPIPTPFPTPLPTPVPTPADGGPL
jgi:fibro-slime domain-containing protein